MFDQSDSSSRPEGKSQDSCAAATTAEQVSNRSSVEGASDGEPDAVVVDDVAAPGCEFGAGPVSIVMHDSLTPLAPLTGQSPYWSLSGGSSSGAMEVAFDALLRDWWLESRPLWTDPGWYDAILSPPARALLDLAPGPALVAGLSRIPSGVCVLDHAGEGFPASPDIGASAGFPCECQLVVAAGWEACSSWIQSQATANIVDVMGPQPVEMPARDGAPRFTDPAREEVALVLRVSPASMLNRIGTARNLADHTKLLGLVNSGGIAFWSARLLVEDVAHLSADKQQQVIEYVSGRVIDRIRSGLVPWTSTQIRQLAKRAMLRIAPDQARQAKKRRYQDRAVSVFGFGDGMASLEAIIAETDAHQIMNRLTNQADQLNDPTRTRNQKRADILINTLLQPTCTPSPNPKESSQADSATHDSSTDPVSARGSVQFTHSGGGSGVEIQVIVKLETLLGLDQDLAEVPGLGPIPADVARELAADGKWRAWITNAAGTIITTSTRGYSPSVGLARLIRAREPYCRMPGCQRPAMKCDLDHASPWPTGQTTAENLGPLCRRHHNLKTHHGWRLDVALPHPRTATPELRGRSPARPCPVAPDSDPEAGGSLGQNRTRESKAAFEGAGTTRTTMTQDPTADPWVQAPTWTWTTPTGKTVHSDPNQTEPVEYPF